MVRVTPVPHDLDLALRHQQMRNVSHLNKDGKLRHMYKILGTHLLTIQIDPSRPLAGAYSPLLVES